VPDAGISVRRWCRPLARSMPVPGPDQ
jgi:hypothetical protein